MLYLSFFAWLISLGIMSSKSIHVVADGRISFFFYCWIVPIVYIYHIFFIQPSISEHPCYFYVLAIVNNAVMNMLVRISFVLLFLFPLDKYRDVKLLDHMGILVLISWGTSMMTSTVAGPISVPTNSARGLPFLCTHTSTRLSSFW